MRINKYLTYHGVCSRRQADALIAAGRVKVNGVVVELGTQVADDAVVSVDNVTVEPRARALYIKLNKPPGVVCTSDPREPDNVIDFVNHPERLFHVGRLDKFSSGLIFLTNDGEIVNRILRSQYGNEKEYVVKVDRPFDHQFLRDMAQGVPILEEMTHPCTVRRMGPRTFQIILKQGRNRQIRRMVESLGYRVIDLKRVRIMHVRLGDMKVGEWREFTPEEAEELLARLAEQAVLDGPNPRAEQEWSED